MAINGQGRVTQLTYMNQLAKAENQTYDEKEVLGEVSRLLQELGIDGKTEEEQYEIQLEAVSAAGAEQKTDHVVITRKYKGIPISDAIVGETMLSAGWFNLQYCNGQASDFDILFYRQLGDESPIAELQITEAEQLEPVMKNYYNTPVRRKMLKNGQIKITEIKTLLGPVQTADGTGSLVPYAQVTVQLENGTETHLINLVSGKLT